MAKLVAIDWDRFEVRTVVARTQGDEIAIEQLETTPIALDAQESNIAGLEEQLTQALGKQRLPRSQTLTAIGRSLCELRTLSMPPSPPEELPEMVRFQAQREFSSLSDNAPLDYLPLGEEGAEPGEVVAAAISSDLANQVTGALTSSGLDLERMVMRPAAAMSFALRRCERSRQGVTLVIAPLAESAELTIAKNGVLVFTRSFRLPPDWQPGETGEPLLGEVRRTIAAARNQLGGSAVEHIVLFGTKDRLQGLSERLAERTQLDVELVDPLEGTSVRKSDLPERPERFAALLGMLTDEAAGVAPAIDFKNPRKKPEPKSNTSRYILYGAAAAALLLAVTGGIYWKYSATEASIAKLNKKLIAYNQDNDRLKPTATLATSLDRWKESDRNWLEELRVLSTIESVGADDFMLESFQATAQDGLPGEVSIIGRAKSDAAKGMLQTALRGDKRTVRAGRTTTSKTDKRYPKEFITVVTTGTFHFAHGEESRSERARRTSS